MRQAWLSCLLCISLPPCQASVETDIRDRIVHDLGMANRPDVQHANVSVEEYERMLRVYQRSVRQTEAIRELRQHFNEHLEEQVVITKVLQDQGSDLIRRKRSLEFNSEILSFNLSSLSASVLVDSASLLLSLKDILPETQVRVSQVLEDGEIGVDTVTTVGDDDGVTLVKLDVSHAVSGWMTDPTGSRLELKVSHDRSQAWSLQTAEMVLQTRQIREGAVLRQRRQVRDSECQNMCCRKKMPVNIRDLEGFAFIYQPRVFDAAFCGGRCPPRYHPLNDHSLLQSLMHIKSRRAAQLTGKRRRAKIKNTCCSPARFENLDILHLDEKDPTKLRVTNWKNIIVGDCACA